MIGQYGSSCHRAKAALLTLIETFRGYCFDDREKSTRSFYNGP